MSFVKFISSFLGFSLNFLYDHNKLVLYGNYVSLKIMYKSIISSIICFIINVMFLIKNCINISILYVKCVEIYTLFEIKFNFNIEFQNVFIARKIIPNCSLSNLKYIHLIICIYIYEVRNKNCKKNNLYTQRVLKFIVEDRRNNFLDLYCIQYLITKRFKL